jgi:hypothetical protein
MQINFNSPKNVVVVSQQTATFSSLTIQRMIDLPAQKKVVVYLQQVNEPITLWEGASYDSIGQWTNTDVANAILALYGATGSFS